MVERWFAVPPNFDVAMNGLAVSAVPASVAQYLMEIEYVDEMFVTDVLLETNEGLVLHELVHDSCCGEEALGVSRPEGYFVKGVELNC